MVLMMELCSEMSLCFQKIGPVHCTLEQQHKLVCLTSFGQFDVQLFSASQFHSKWSVLSGVIPTEGIPCLLKVLLPSSCAGLPVL